MARGRGDDGQILQSAVQALFDFCAHPLRTVVVDQELQARLGAREAVLGILAPDVQDGACGGEHVLGLDEHAQVARDARGRGEPAAHA